MKCDSIVINKLFNKTKQKLSAKLSKMAANDRLVRLP